MFPTSSAFGAARPQTSIFGQPTGTTQPAFGQAAPSTFGNFGATQTGGNQQQQTGTGTGIFGAFGANNNQQQPQQQQTQQTGGFGTFGAAQQSALFGNAPKPGGFAGFGTQPATNTGTNIFGQNTNQAPQGSTLFGQQQPQQQNAGGFGTNPFQQRQPAQQPNFFGQANPAPQQNAWGFGGIGQQQQQQAPPPPPPPTFNKSDKFNTLSAESQQRLEEVESYIQNQIRISAEIKAASLGPNVEKASKLLREVTKNAETTANTVNLDLLIAQDIMSKINQSVNDVAIATRIVDGYRNHAEKGAWLTTYASFPFEYFARLAEDMRERLHRYKANVEQIEHKLVTSLNSEQRAPQAISAALRAQHTIFISLADKVAELDSELQKLKAGFTAAWRAQAGSVRDPFDARDSNNASQR